jgi:uracil-DNA glycosylase family 4
MDNDALTRAIEEKLGSDLAYLRKVITNCRRCRKGGGGIPGTGEPGSSLFLLAGKPGPASCAGNPWGEWWDLLRDRAVGEWGWDVADVYLSTALRCPVGDVTPSELRRCAPFLAEELFIVGPRVVVVCGKLAAVALRAAFGEEVPGKPKAGDECRLFSMRFVFELDVARVGREEEAARIFWDILRRREVATRQA